LTPGQFFVKDLLANPVLLWAVLGGIATTVLRTSAYLRIPWIYASLLTAIYIPVFSNRVFYQSGITWEWGIVFGMSIAFLIWCEMWKLIRRPLYKRWTPIVNTSIPSDEVVKEKISENTKNDKSR
jgi:Na+-exporting ATPase